MNISKKRGGIGQSGMGNYHGEWGFKAFSHYKSILRKPFWVEIKLNTRLIRNLN
jgi:aldehyde dehydrogenase (NAD+)